MSGVARSVPDPIEPEDLPTLGPACELCGDEWDLTPFPLWSEERGYWTGTRCVDGPSCRGRQEAARAPQPMQPARVPSAEGDDDDSWL